MRHGHRSTYTDSSVRCCRKKAAAAACAEGRLEAATSNNPFGKTDASASATADEPDIQAEAAAMAVLAAERLAALLDFNAQRLGPKAGLKVLSISIVSYCPFLYVTCAPDPL